jgi:hypothetical protein
MIQDLPKSAVLDYEPAATDSRSVYRWLVVAMLWCVCLFNYADRQAIYSVFPLLTSEMGLSDIQLGIVGGSFMWVYAAALPFAGIIGDTISRKTLILGGLVFWSLITSPPRCREISGRLVIFRGLEAWGSVLLPGFHVAHLRLSLPALPPGDVVSCEGVYVRHHRRRNGPQDFWRSDTAGAADFTYLALWEFFWDLFCCSRSRNRNAVNRSRLRLLPTTIRF